MSQFVDNELESQIQRLLDGTISAEDFSKLQQHLSHDPQARRVYYELVSLHQGLQFRLSPSTKTYSAADLGQARLKQQQIRARKVTALMAVALVAITLTILQLLRINNQERSNEGFCKLEASEGSIFSISNPNPEKSKDTSTLGINSRLTLEQGTVQLMLESGVTAIINAPADLTLKSEALLQMPLGVGHFTVPENAIGFTIKTAELRIVDLGTQFGVLSEPTKPDELHVFKGAVEASALSGLKQQLALQAGNALSIQPNGKFSTIKVDSDKFLTSLPAELLHQHWSFDDPGQLLARNTTTARKDLSYEFNPPGQEELLQSPGKFGNALRLDGISNYLTTNWNGITGDEPRTVAFWLKLPTRSGRLPGGGITRSIIAWGEQQSHSVYRANINSKWTIHLDYPDNEQAVLNVSFGGFWYAARPELEDGQWHHLAVVYHGQADQKGNPKTDLYIDGQARKTNIAFHSPIRKNRAGNVVINTMDKSPLQLGANLKWDYSQYEPAYLKAEIDELFIIEGAVDQAAIERIRTKNQLN